jgi:SAM-dependent methyltransferase
MDVVSSCGLCKGKAFQKVFDWGMLSLGFPVEPYEASTSQIWQEELALEICKRCFLVQTVHKIPHEKLGQENLYLSECSKLILDHYEYLSSYIPSLLSLPKDSLILEIGCGDGSLLRKFRQKGFENVIGVEPAIHPQREYPFGIIADFFNSNVVKILKNAGKYPDCIISNSVLYQVPDLDIFFTNLSSLMKKGSFAVIEVEYFNDAMRNLRFDGFAHLRCYWFTVNSLIYAFNKYKLQIIDIERDPDYRGGILRVIATKNKHSKENLKPHLLDWKDRELRELSSQSLKSFGDKINQIIEVAQGKIAELIEQKISIYGYGGGIKAATIVNSLNLTSKEVKMVVDMDPNKHGKVIPVANIPIRPVSDLFEQEESGKKAVIILALDHAVEVEKLLLEKLKKNSMIIYILPEFRVVTV